MKLHSREKKYLCQLIEQACGGTPLQPNAEFAGTYLTNLLVSQLENWEPVRKGLGLPSLVRDKVVLNKCFGGFGVSQEGFELYHSLIEEPLPVDKYSKDDAKYYWQEKLERDDPYLVQVVEQLGEKANGISAKLCIESVTPKLWAIKDHDGYERLEFLCNGIE